MNKKASFKNHNSNIERSSMAVVTPSSSRF